MAEVHEVSVEIGGAEIVFETGRLAKQASGAVLVASGDTRVLATATAGNLRDIDFMPLTVDIEERMYAAGKIPGSFFKREGRAGEKATLIARMIDRPLRPLFPKGWRYETQLVSIPLSIDHDHPYDILAMNGASAALMVSNIPFPTPGRRGAHRQGRGQLRRQPDRGAAAHGRPRPRGRGHRRGHPDGRGGRQRDHRGRDARRARHRPRRDQEALRRAARARRQGAEGEARGHRADGRRGPLPPDRAVARRAARPGHERAGQDRAPERHQGRRGGGARRTTPATRPSETYAEYRVEGAARVRQAREEHDPPAHRGPQEAPGRPLGEGDPPDRDRGRPPAAHARLRAVHARADAGAVGGRARHDARGDAPGQPRARDVQALLPPLQLPAVLGGRGRLHARPEAPRHRPRRARRARAGPDDPVAGGVPLHDPRRVGHPRVQRLLVDGLGVRLLALADGRRRAAQGAGRRRGDGPHQGGRRLHRPDRHRRRRGPPRRHGLQGRRHGERDHRAPDGHQDHGRHVRDPARRAHAGARGPAVHPRQDARVDRRAAQRALELRPAHLVDPDRPGQDRPADRQGRRDDPRPLARSSRRRSTSRTTAPSASTRRPARRATPWSTASGR